MPLCPLKVEKGSRELHLYSSQTGVGWGWIWLVRSNIDYISIIKQSQSQFKYSNNALLRLSKPKYIETSNKETKDL